MTMVYLIAAFGFNAKTFSLAMSLAALVDTPEELSEFVFVPVKGTQCRCPQRIFGRFEDGIVRAFLCLAFYDHVAIAWVVRFHHCLFHAEMLNTFSVRGSGMPQVGMYRLVD